MTLACNENLNSSVYNPELIFPGAFKINIEVYNYVDEATGKIFRITGDTLTDTVNNAPYFRWEFMSDGIYTVAISSEPFQTNGKEIQNSDKVLWQWHVGMSEDRIFEDNANVSFVSYYEGRSVENKKILYNTQPLPLQNGLYYWAVWGWDITGTKILYASKQRKFFVD